MSETYTYQKEVIPMMFIKYTGSDNIEYVDPIINLCLIYDPNSILECDVFTINGHWVTKQEFERVKKLINPYTL